MSSTLARTALLQQKRINEAPPLAVIDEKETWMTVDAVSLAEKLSTFSEYWSLKIVSQFNGWQKASSTGITMKIRMSSSSF